jgi:hypothetical protein
MWVIIWYHVKACVADLRACRLGDLTITAGRKPGQVHIGNEHQEWRLR